MKGWAELMRYVINRISSTIIRKEVPSINALDVLRSLKDGLDQHPSITAELRERYMNYIAVARKEYDNIAKMKSKKHLSTPMKSLLRHLWITIWIMSKPTAIKQSFATH